MPGEKEPLFPGVSSGVKVLAFSHDARLYGAQRSLLELLDNLRNRSHHPILVAPADGPLLSAAASTQIPCRIQPYPLPSTRPIRALRFLLGYPRARGIRDLVAREEPDILLFNTTSCIAPAAVLRRSRPSRVWHVREYPPFPSLISPLIAAWSDRVVFNSRYMASRFAAGKASMKSAVVYNGVRVIPPDRRSIALLRNHFGWRQEEVVVAFAGQFRPHKNPTLLLKLLKLLRKREFLSDCVSLETAP